MKIRRVLLGVILAVVASVTSGCFRYPGAEVFEPSGIYTPETGSIIGWAVETVGVWLGILLPVDAGGGAGSPPSPRNL